MGSKLMGRKAIITGGSRGIGKAALLALVKEGAEVLFTYQSNEMAAREVEILASGLGGKATRFKADSTKLSDIESIYKKANDIFHSQIDIVILNAFPSAIFKPTAFLSETDYDQMFAGTKGNYFLLQKAATTIQDGGKIIVLSSGAANFASPAGGAYAGAKAAVERFALSLAKEVGNRNVSVNAVSPGVTQTDGLIAPKEMIDSLIAQTPMGRLGTPEDVANTILLLSLPEASWISAQVLQANGGMM